MNGSSPGVNDLGRSAAGGAAEIVEILRPIQLNKSPVLSKVPQASDDAPTDHPRAAKEEGQEDDDAGSEPFRCHDLYRLVNAVKSVIGHYDSQSEL